MPQMLKAPKASRGKRQTLSVATPRSAGQPLAYGSRAGCAQSAAQRLVS